jgi:predicted ATP-grasp superfamily ATP-dependent carboligase
MYPPFLGNSTLMESVSLDYVAGAVDTIRRMFAELPHRGIFSAEFKFDDRDQQFKIIEVNARPWWFVEFASRSGVDVCTMSYRDALEQDVPQAGPYRSGQRCVYLPNDFKSFRSGKEGTLLDWVKSWFGGVETVFAFDDPMPGTRHMLETVADHFRRKKLS